MRTYHCSHMLICSTASYKVISEYKLPMPLSTIRSRVYSTPHHVPLILLPSHGEVKVASLSHFKPRQPPPFPLDETNDPSPDVISRDAIPVLPCQTIKDTNEQPESSDSPSVEVCCMNEDGRVLIAAGEREAIWIWRVPEQ